MQVGLVYQTDVKKRHMYQLGVRISIAGTKSYVELIIAKLSQPAGTPGKRA